MNEFLQAALAVPGEHRCLQSSPGVWGLPLEHCIFGVPPDDAFGWTVLDRIPEDLKGVHFYLGGECVELIAAFARSAGPRSVERLSLGNSSFAIGEGLDYAAAVRQLGSARYPQLKSLDLGVWELFSNSHCLFGTLGDVTSVLRNSPELERLGLYGSFELTEALRFGSLRDLTVTLEDPTTGSNGGHLSHATLANLLESDFPRLEVLFLDLECEDDDAGYHLPDGFLAGARAPELKKIEVTGGFREGERARLLGSPLGTRPELVLHLDDMTGS